MKTLTDITLLIHDIMRDIDEARKYKSSSRQLKHLKNKLDHMNVCKLYIETMPNPEFIEQEIRRLTGRKNAIMQFRPKGVYMNKEYQAIIKKWEKEQGIERINKQLKTLNFLIK